MSVNCFKSKPGTLLKVKLLDGRFSRFLNCTNGTKSCKASQYGTQEMKNYSAF